SLSFLNGYAHHRALHSFPTRRSSDLPGSVASSTGCAGPTGWSVPTCSTCWAASAERRASSCWPCSTAIATPGSSTSSSPAQRSRSEEHTSELQSRRDLVCRLLLEKKK